MQEANTPALVARKNTYDRITRKRNEYESVTDLFSFMIVHLRHVHKSIAKISHPLRKRASVSRTPLFQRDNSITFLKAPTLHHDEPCQFFINYIYETD